ncbi:MAG: MCE family protein [Hyphomonadaceae bacterium]|nr:MCE family protein [Hyphomonadaceae bacterium]
METKANYVLIGAATVIGAVLMMLFAMWMATGDLRRGFNQFDVVFADPVRGLTEGGEVRFNGIKVGEVDDLRIDAENSNRVIARIRVSADVPVRTDSEAQLEPIGLTGVTLIQLSSGSPDSPLLRSSGFGPPPRLQGRGSQIDILVARSEDIALRASEAMAAVRDLITEENIARVTRILNNLETVSTQLADRRSVVYTSGEAAQEIADLARQMRTQTAELDQVMTNLNRATAAASGETLPELTSAAEEIRRAAASISRVANNLEDNPSVLTPRSPRPTVELRP